MTDKFSYTPQKGLQGVSRKILNLFFLMLLLKDFDLMEYKNRHGNIITQDPLAKNIFFFLFPNINMKRYLKILYFSIILKKLFSEIIGRGR